MGRITLLACVLSLLHSGASLPGGMCSDEREAALREAFARFAEAWVARDKKAVAAAVATDQEGPSPRRFAAVFCKSYGIRTLPKIQRLIIEGDLARVDTQVEWAFDLKEEMGDMEPVGTEFTYWKYKEGQWRYLYTSLWNPNRKEWEEHCAFLVSKMRLPESREDAEAAVAATQQFVELLRTGNTAALAELVSRHRYFSNEEASWEREFHRENWAARTMKYLTEGYAAWEPRRKATYWKAFLTEEKLARAGGCTSERMGADSFEPATYMVFFDATRKDGTRVGTALYWVKEPEGMRLWRWS